MGLTTVVGSFWQAAMATPLLLGLTEVAVVHVAPLLSAQNSAMVELGGATSLSAKYPKLLSNEYTKASMRSLAYCSARRVLRTLKLKE